MKALLIGLSMLAGSCHASPAENAQREAGYWWAAGWHEDSLGSPAVPPVNCRQWLDPDFRMGCESFMKDLDKLEAEDGEVQP